MYDDPPKKENFVNPYYRSKRTSLFKTDHPELSYKNQGHLMNDERTRNLEEGRQRMYTEWQPPTGKEERMGKKILAEKPRNDGLAFQELE
jgi:hypothetical protein